VCKPRRGDHDQKPLRVADRGRAGVTTQPGNPGAVEGNINRVKMIKRQMYGRAKLDLLRKRILATP
jgi:transposase